MSLVCVLQRPGVGLGEHHGVAVEGHGQAGVGLHGHAHRQVGLAAPCDPLLDLQPKKNAQHYSYATAGPISELA